MSQSERPRSDRATATAIEDASIDTASQDDSQRADRGSRLRSKPMIRLLQGSFGVAVLLLWQGASWAGLVDPLTVPAPIDIAKATDDVITGPMFFDHLKVTIYETVLGFVGGALLGFAVGAGIAASRLARQVIYPYIVALQSPPKVVLAPILVTWFGYDMSSKVAMAIVISFFPMFINTLSGLTRVDEQSVLMMKSLTASKYQVFWKVRLPDAAPMVMAGLRLCWTFSIIGVIVAEFIGSRQGIGYLIQLKNFQLQMPEMFALIIMLSAFTVIVYYILEYIEKKAVFWP